MANNTLIRVVTTKAGKMPIPQYFTFACLTGEFVNRLYKVHDKIEVEEVCLDEDGKQSTIDKVLTPNEQKALIARWPHLTPPDSMPPEPEPLPTKKVESVKVEVDDSTPSISEQVESQSEGEETDYSQWEVSELKELLTNNNIKFDKRIKKSEKLIEIIKTNKL